MSWWSEYDPLLGETSPEFEGMAPIHLAAYFGDVEEVERLGRIIDNIDVKDHLYRRTALHWACVGGFQEVVKVLIELGADVNAKDKFGNTPLHLTMMWGTILGTLE